MTQSTRGSGPAWPLRLMLAMTACLTVFEVLAQSDCAARAASEYERIYCQVISKGQGAGLPSLEDFRRNDPGVQALLLKRPAAQLGITLPKPAAAKMPRSTPASTPEPGAVQQLDTSPTPVAPPEADLAGCRLQGEVINCPRRSYQLVSNQPNRALAPGALDDSQKLDLPLFQGRRQDEPAARRYLFRAYEVYITKMLAIGLGAATLSFTEFYHGFFRHEAEGVDFAERLEKTYQLLKQDKKTHAIKARFHSRLPKSIAACMTLNSEIIVCDDVETNWIYTDTP